MPDDFDPSSYDTCVFDLDGTVWLGGTAAIPGAIDVIERCRAGGATVAFATNATVHRPDAVATRLIELGLAQPGDPVITSGLVITESLRGAGITHVATVVPDDLAAIIADAGISVTQVETAPSTFDLRPGPDRALVMAASRAATIGAIEQLGRLAITGHPLYVSSQDPGYPTAHGLEPGGGVLLAAMAAMYPVDPIVLGKPSAAYADVVVRSIGRPTGRIAMFGDSQRADMGLAHELGADGILLTNHSVVDVDASLPLPTFVAASLADVPSRYG